MVAAISVGDASSFQAQYQQLVENWVWTWLALRKQHNFERTKDENEVNEVNKEADVLPEFGQKEVEITQTLSDGSEKLLYGKNDQVNQVNLLTPELITALERANLGDKLDSWGAITIRAGDEILFQSEQSGKVIVNQRVNVQNVARVDTQKRFTPVESSHSEKNSVPSNVSGKQNGVAEEDFSVHFRQDDLNYAGNYSRNFDSDYSRGFDSNYSREHTNSASQDTADTQKDKDAYLQVLAELMVPLVLSAMKEPQASISTTNQKSATFPESLTQKDEQLGLFEDFFVASSLIQVAQKTQTDGQEKQEFTRAEEVLNPVTRSNGKSKENVSVGVKVPSTGQAKQKATQTGLEALFVATSELQDSPAKQVLQETSKQMQTALLEQQSSPPSVVMQELVEHRLQSKNNPNWWQQLPAKIEMVVTKVRDSFMQHRAASTLKQFANSIGLLSSESYEAANYTLSKQGQKYTLFDNQKNPLLRFESTVFGVKVDNNLPSVSEADLVKIELLRADISTGKSPGGAFLHQAVSEGSRLAQIQRIQAAMSDFAAQTPKADIQVEGSTYNWRANSKGSAIIQDKQGNVLLVAGNGFMRSSMSDKQLSDFEQMIIVASSRTNLLQKKAAELQFTANSKTKDKDLELD